MFLAQKKQIFKLDFCEKKLTKTTRPKKLQISQAFVVTPYIEYIPAPPNTCILYILGPYIFQIMDDYGGGMSVLWIAIFEMICIAWFYGANKLNKDFNFMLDISLKNCCSMMSHVIIVALWYIIPLLLTIILVLSLITFDPPSFGEIQYPSWVHAIGYFLVVLAAAQFPIWAFFSILYYMCHPAKRVSCISYSSSLS